MAMRGNYNGGMIGLGSRTRTSPIPVQRTGRVSAHRTLTSCQAGKMVPLAAIPLLREDSVPRAQFRVGLSMLETVEILMNGVTVRVLAYLVPKLAFERFGGSIDAVNKSYEGQPLTEGGQVTPWFVTEAAGAPGTNPIHDALGVHAKAGTLVNTDYVEAYNAIWNFRAKNRSPSLALRAVTDKTLAPAFWNHQTWANVVPDFDQAIIDGEVPVNIVGGNIPVVKAPTGAAPTGAPLFVPYGQPGNTPMGLHMGTTGNTQWTGDFSNAFPGAVASPPSGAMWHTTGLVAEMGALAGTSISLSNIELARKTQAFANLRRQYSGHSDEYIIDLLMDGIEIPDQAWQQPMLLADQTSQFGMAKRFASDGPSLTESVVNGITYLDIGFSVPRCNTGGVVMLVLEIAPEQLFERQKDPYVHAQSVDELPQFLRDTLDPEKVEIVTNDFVDVNHSNPTGTFGYAPLNYKWQKSMPRVGGKFLRPTVDTPVDEDRMRIWAVETADPVLTTDFYLVTGMHYKPFVVTDDAIDHFEVQMRGAAAIQGNTVFGGTLIEATDEYQEVLEEAPQERIDKNTGSPLAEQPEV